MESAYEDDGLETQNRPRILACQLVMLNCKAKEEIIADSFRWYGFAYKFVIIPEYFKNRTLLPTSSFGIKQKLNPGNSDRAIGQSRKDLTEVKGRSEKW